MRLTLFGEDGKELAQWSETLPAGAGSYAIDSREVRRKFKLGEFTGQLFVHASGVSGHDVVKYALDVYGDEGQEPSLSCTHDANSWPSDLYAGLPAPRPGEAVTLWVQNSMPCVIPPGSVGLNLMGESKIVYLNQAIAPFASHALDVASAAARQPPGRSRSKSIPANTWCGRVTR